MEFDKTESRQVKKSKPNSGRKSNQRLKLYLVMHILLKKSDENEPISADKIADLLQVYGIEAERRSIYKDIEDINKAYVMLRDNCSIDDAEQRIAKNNNKRNLMIIRTQNGFYVNNAARQFQLSDIRLIAECIYASKFIPQESAERLANSILENFSESQSRKIKHDAIVVDRVKTLNKTVLENISIIRDAMVKRKTKYIVSPYYLIINDGNYYLLSYDNLKKDVRTYRVDRMNDIARTGKQREGLEQIRALDIQNYTQRVFSMYGGQKTSVKLRFENSLLDTVIDRFGTRNAIYVKLDAEHFMVACEVEISPQFYGWLCGFGQRVRIVAPELVKEDYIKYIEDISFSYED